MMKTNKLLNIFIGSIIFLSIICNITSCKETVLDISKIYTEQDTVTVLRKVKFTYNIDRYSKDTLIKSGSTINPPKVSDNDSIFVGYFEVKNDVPSEIPFSFYQRIDSDITLYGIFAPSGNAFTVRFLFKGIPYVNDLHVPYMAKINAPSPDPSYADSTFLGWYKIGSSSAFNFTTGLIKESTTFVAKFKFAGIYDKEGNSYKIVTIGTQTWMAENLRTTKYNDGTSIIQMNTGNFELLPTTATSTKDSGYVYTNPSKPAYGYYYNYYAAKTGKLAPAGWHIPTSAEWNTLVTYVKNMNATNPGLAVKSLTGWADDATAAGLDKYGFNALPAGFVYNVNNIPTFSGAGSAGYWLGTETYPGNNANCYVEQWSLIKVFEPLSRTKTRGFTIRCIKDN